MNVAEAMKIVTDAMKADPDYAWSWHCNIAMAYVDAGGDRDIGNQGAERFMRLLAGVEPAHPDCYAHSSGAEAPGPNEQEESAQPEAREALLPTQLMPACLVPSEYRCAVADYAERYARSSVAASFAQSETYRKALGDLVDAHGGLVALKLALANARAALSQGAAK